MHLDDVFGELLSLVSTAGAQVDVPINGEQFFSRLVDTFPGTKEEFLCFG